MILKFKHRFETVARRVVCNNLQVLAIIMNIFSSEVNQGYSRSCQVMHSLNTCRSTGVVRSENGLGSVRHEPESFPSWLSTGTGFLAISHINMSNWLLRVRNNLYRFLPGRARSRFPIFARTNLRRRVVQLAVRPYEYYYHEYTVHTHCVQIP